MGQSAGEHSVDLMIGRIDEAVARLLASAEALSDEQMREPSLLPGWSRGHVLTHVARNADGLSNLLAWARTGTETPQYASQDERDAQIAAGAGRPAAEICADVAQSAEEFTARAAELSAQDWTAQVRGLRGPAHPAWFTLHRRLTEVHIHHVDLAAGYEPADWPDWFIADMLYRVTGQLAGDEAAPAAVLTDADTGRQFLLRPDLGSELVITGPGHALLAWLTGRDSGAGLAPDPPGPLPSVPPY